MRQKIPKKVLILGSGGLQIGQAGEFDYSGTQAIKALKEEGIRVVLLNPNIATVQTDKGLADTVYFLPITLDFAAEIIKKERPDGLLLGFGGQTALNVGVQLDRAGVLRKYNVRVLGTPVSTIRDTEDRGRFIRRLNEIYVKTARGRAVRNVRDAVFFARELGYPVMVRAAFALGGAHSGVVPNEQTLREKLIEAFQSSPQVLVEEYLGGWKEVEYEVVRDASDNCMTVCNMENMDPMGIHTGDSIVVAPSQTLTNEEYQRLRAIAIKVVRHLGVVGECNIQYALNPKTGDYRVIEVNARLSRSSALASKATGYPLAFVAARLALGHALTDLPNNITKVTKAFFEPALDYVVVKIPRWDLAKFREASRVIGSEMKSVGEVMAIGRTFEETLQKAIRMLAIGQDGLVGNSNPMKFENPSDEIRVPTDRRLFAIGAALERGRTVAEIERRSAINPWFLEKIQNVTRFALRLRGERMAPSLIREAKHLGFSDRQIANLRGKSEEEVRSYRMRHRITPFVKQIDTLAGEFPAKTNYLYLTYHGTEHDVRPESHSVVVLGSGPYCIGSSVEFDWCGVQAVREIRQQKERAIMVNCNPETVSTDYDVSDRLYFEELSEERVRDIVAFESPRCVVVSTGGQIPNNLALGLTRHGVRIAGTKPEDIDRVEDRHKFSTLLDQLGIEQPPWVEARSQSEAKKEASALGYPVLIRPSYVLSGAAMNVVFDETALARFLGDAVQVSAGHPVVVSKFIEDANEIEIDGVADHGRVVRKVLTEHVEFAGTHSGDATIVIPPRRTSPQVLKRAEEIARKIASAINITGPFNIQYLVKNGNISVIEANLRASRSFPFVSKATGENLIRVAVRAQLGRTVRGREIPIPRHITVKAPQFSYHRIKNADPVAYVEMASTGEVACFGNTFDEALLKSLVAAGLRLPKKNIFLSIGKETNKERLRESLVALAGARSYRFYATEHTADFLRANGVRATKVYKIHTKKHPNVADCISRGAFDFMVVIPAEYLKREQEDGFIIRRRAVDMNIPLVTNVELAAAFFQALARVSTESIRVLPWNAYV